MFNIRSQCVSYTIRRDGVTMERGRLLPEDSNTLAMQASRGIMDMVVRAGEGARIHLRTVCDLGDGRYVGTKLVLTCVGANSWDVVDNKRATYRRCPGYQVGRSIVRGFPAKAWPKG